MRRSLVFVGVAAAALFATAGLSSAGIQPTFTVTPNPVVAGEDITIANSPDAASTCEVDSGSKLAEGDEVINTVDVSIADSEANIVFEETATPDEGGNWQVVTQLTEPGEYTVLAVCNGTGGGGGGGLTAGAEAVGPFTYAPEALTVTGDAPPPPVDPPPVTPPAAQPQDLQPAFTG
jgi:hypothetical protein